MSLKEYKKKRNFSKTPEPKGLGSTGINTFKFYVQQHDASRLHYDFRLEINGVLKSWAIPKGPSLDPDEKRLAIMVEDHPMEYGPFEGTIPEGNYGAGTVQLWDQGTYEIPQKYVKGNSNTETLDEMLNGQDIKVFLKGQKLQGEFALVGFKKEENQWLLIKKDDEYASQADVLKKDKSVLSDKKLSAISDSNDGFWISSAKKVISLEQYDELNYPETADPMMAYLVDDTFNREGWIFELKYDGYRAVSHVHDDGSVQILSRNRKKLNNDYKLILEELKKINENVILDGEIVVMDDQGRSDFQLIQNYKKQKKGNLAYYIFDITYFNGKDLSKAPLTDRKYILNNLLLKEEYKYLRYSDHLPENGKYLYSQAEKLNLEGIIAKKAASTYQYGKRSKDWLKIKIIKQQEVVIAGYTKPHGSRKYFGSLVLGVMSGGKLQFIGSVGTGFSDSELERLHKIMLPLEKEKCPFDSKPEIGKDVIWLKPKLVAEIKFQEWTDQKKVRQASFLGLREDKKPKEVRREVPKMSSGEVPSVRGKSKNRKPADNTSGYIKKQNHKTKLGSKVIENNKIDDQEELKIELNGKSLKFTNLNKAFWPDLNIKKKDVINYYSRMEKFILPYLQNRPESLKRNPNGIKDNGFFQKDVPESFSEWLHTEKIESETNEGPINYLICNDKETLLYMANLGCIEINPWSSTYKRPDKPVYSVIDLDPKDISFDEVVKVALKVKEVLDIAGIKGYPKTSGSKGIHVYIPLGEKYSYDHAKDFTEILVNYVHQLLPDLTSLERKPSKRKNKVYLDYLQNRKAQTIAAPYCLRPREKATVSTPLFWHEIKPGKLYPENFTIDNIFDRLEEIGDIFHPVLKETIDMEKALSRLSEYFD